jgi:6-phosphogluconolactonase
LSREIIRHHDAEDLATEVAARLATTIARVQAEHGSASVALTGGRIAGSVLFALADPIAVDAIDWSRVDLWWGDERYLSSGDPERNDFLADTRLLSQVRISPEHVHRIPGPDRSSSLEEAAEAYAGELASSAAVRARDGRPAFDIVLLSIGPDGHVASLFPESASLDSPDWAIAVHHSPKPPAMRVTVGFNALNDSTEAWMMASGAEKAEIIDLMLTRGAGPLQIPAAGIQAQGRTLLLIDESAASRLATDIGKRES